MKNKAIVSLCLSLLLFSIIPVKNVYADGWANDASKRFWYTEGGSYATGWKNIKNDWYFFDTNGYRVDNNWVKNGSKWYFVDAGGRMIKDSTVDGYCLDSNGAWTGKTSSIITAKQAVDLVRKNDPAALELEKTGTSLPAAKTDNSTFLMRSLKAANMPSENYYVVQADSSSGNNKNTWYVGKTSGNVYKPSQTWDQLLLVKDGVSTNAAKIDLFYIM